MTARASEVCELLIFGPALERTQTKPSDETVLELVRPLSQATHTHIDILIHIYIIYTSQSEHSDLFSEITDTFDALR